MSYDYYDEYVAELHGVLQTLVSAARIDKKLQRESFRRVFGDELGEWLIHINTQPGDPRLYLLARWIEGETIKAFLRGRYSGELVVPPQAKALMFEMAASSRFDWFKLPKKLTVDQQVMRNLRVER